MAAENRAFVGSIVVAGAILVAGSPFLMGFLQKWESGKARVLVVYADPLAGGLPTVCNGLTRHVTSTPIIVGERWTDEQCDAEERSAVVAVQKRLAPCFKRPPSQMVFDMATSHAWNLGPAATCGSGAMTAWNRGQWTLGCQRIARGDDGTLVWSYTCKTVGGQRQCTFVQGLANRRADEAQTCGEVL
ncbi:lysozyme [Variovorax paradoxus]|uniref:lysozyme n=1 Tax=Variovorax paradoxus TaxID=34073 RepID=UPI00399BBCC7